MRKSWDNSREGEPVVLLLLREATITAGGEYE
jgi:hypothetical protein